MLSFLVLVIILFLVIAYIIYGLLKLDNFISEDSDDKTVINIWLDAEDEENFEKLRNIMISPGEYNEKFEQIARLADELNNKRR